MTPRGAMAHARLCILFPDCAIFVFQREHWKMAPMDLSGRYSRFGIVPPENAGKKLCICPELIDGSSHQLDDEDFLAFMAYWECRLELRLAAIEAGEDLINVESAIDRALLPRLTPQIYAILEAA